MNKIKINECQYWLLDSMLRRSIFTGWILPDSHKGVDIPPFISIFSIEELTISLLELFNAGYLLATIDLPKDRNLFIPTQSQIEIAMTTEHDENYSNGFYVYLSKKGGKIWESLSKPQWDIYTKVLWEKELDETRKVYEAVILGKQLSWLKKRVSNLFDDLNLPMHNYLYPKIIDSKMLTIVPYKPIYWKNLGKCYCINVKFQLTNKENIDKNILNFHRKNMIDISSTSIENYWYIHPYGQFHIHAKNKLRESGHEIN